MCGQPPLLSSHTCRDGRIRPSSGQQQLVLRIQGGKKVAGAKTFKK